VRLHVVIILVTMQFAGCWDVTPCSKGNGYQYLCSDKLGASGSFETSAHIKHAALHSEKVFRVLRFSLAKYENETFVVPTAGFVEVSCLVT
jgi:hypothetical protein